MNIAQSFLEVGNSVYDVVGDDEIVRMTLESLGDWVFCDVQSLEL